MVRTAMPFRHVLEFEKDWWKAFRRALSKTDQEDVRSAF